MTSESTRRSVLVLSVATGLAVAVGCGTSSDPARSASPDLGGVTLSAPDATSPAPTAPRSTGDDSGSGTVPQSSVMPDGAPPPVTMVEPGESRMIPVDPESAQVDFLARYPMNQRDLAALVAAETDEALHVGDTPSAILFGRLPDNLQDGLGLVSFGSDAEVGSGYAAVVYIEWERGAGLEPD